MIYLDNSSTTHKKPYRVRKIVSKTLNQYSVNPSRGGYRLAIKVSEKIFKCRELLADTFNCDPNNVIFTSGCTMALNIAIMGSVKPSGHIITTAYEHNSVLRTLEHIKKVHNITYTIVYPNKNGQIEPKKIEEKINEKTYLIIVNHTSNVTGNTQDIYSIGKICKKHKIKFLVDGAQSVGHEYIDMKKNHVNMLTIAGHKGIYAPTGIGCLLTNNIIINPIIFGGTGTYSNKLKQPKDSPDGFESGTQNISGILGLYEGLKFVNKHQNKINDKINKLTNYLIEELNKIEKIKVYSNNSHSGVVSITIINKDSAEVTNILDEKYGIYTRSGLHCAPLIHKHHNTLINGMTRISISYYNNIREIKKTIKALKKIALS